MYKSVFEKYAPSFSNIKIAKFWLLNWLIFKLQIDIFLNMCSHSYFKKGFVVWMLDTIIT
jgi:hypothetical protein